MSNNIVLYRKYRTQTFGEIIGQEHVVKTLSNSIKGGNISHAYLFAGPRGSGKTTIARLFAKAINCEKPQEGFEPCNKCSSCLEIMAGNSIDLIEIDAASHTGVDDVRQLIEGIKFAPVKSKYKIFIIDECHQLSKPAFNAILKTEDIKELLWIVEVSDIAAFVDLLISKNTKNAISFINTIIDNGADLQEFTKTLIFYLRQQLLLKINPVFLDTNNSGFSAKEIEKIRTQTGELEQTALQNMLELFIDAENKIKYSTITQLPLELAVIKIAHQEL